MSMSRIMLMSMTRSPATAQPAMPYPPERTEGEMPCLRQNETTALTSCASRGETRTRHAGLSFPLNVRARSAYLRARALKGQLDANIDEDEKGRREDILGICGTQHRPVDGGRKLLKEIVREGRWRYGERQVRSRWLDGCHRRGWGSRWRLRSVMRGRIERS